MVILELIRCAGWGLRLGGVMAKTDSGRTWSIGTRIVLPIFLCFFTLAMAVQLGPTWSARLGHGIPGTFTAKVCNEGKGGCAWTGSFVATSGGDRHDGIGIGTGSHITQPGQWVPAIDTGDEMRVYVQGGGSDWFLATSFFLLTLVALGFWIAKVPVAVWRRRHRAEPEPSAA